MAPSEAPRGLLRVSIVVISAAILVAATGIVIAASGDAQQRAFVETRLPARDDVRLTLPAGALAVHVDPTATDVRVSRDERWSVRGRPGQEVVDEGGVLDVRSVCPEVFAIELGGGCEIRLDVVVPPGTRLQIDAGSSEVVVSGTYRALTVHQDVGLTLLSDVCAEELAVRVAAGSTTGAIACAPRTTTIAVGAGSAHLGFPEGRYDLRVDAAGGRADVWSGVVDDRDAPRTLDVRVGSGDLRLVP